MAFKFVKGSDVAITVQIVDKATKLPYQLSDFTSATGYLQKVDSEFLAVSGSLVSEDLGKVKFQVNETQSADLQAGDEVDMQIGIDQGIVRTIFVLKGKLQIIEQII